MARHKLSELSESTAFKAAVSVGLMLCLMAWVRFLLNGGIVPPGCPQGTHQDTVYSGDGPITMCFPDR